MVPAVSQPRAAPAAPATVAAAVLAVVLLVVLAFVIGACAEPPPTWFQETAAERGLGFEHVRGREQRFWFPEIMGGGVGLLDFDGDGRLDVYLVQSGDLASPGPDLVNRLYRNRADGRLEDVTSSAGAGDPGYGMGCACADADGDGDTDIFVTNVGPNALYENDGGAFADATQGAGVGHPGWGTSSAFFDADLDGDLDLYVVNYLNWSENTEIECLTARGRDYCSPNNYEAPAADVLYRNEGDGTFRDVSREAGIEATFGNGLGVAVGDFDDDGYPDVYVANDMMPNQLWHNRGDGTFVDRALLAGCAANMDGESEAGMGVMAADVENDGDLDLFLTHLREETNTLYVNHGGTFTDRTAAMGLAGPSLRHTGFGLGFADLDHDGVLDLFVANGAVTRNRPPFDPDDPYAEPDQLFRGLGEGRFEEVPFAGTGAASAIATGRGAAMGDLDEDGDVDVVVVDSGARARLLENVAPKRGHWIRLRVVERSGADAIGARVRVGAGPRALWREVQPAQSYCSSSDPRVHVGLGSHAAPVEVLVRWPDGVEERFGPLAPDAAHELRRGAGGR